MSNQRNRFFQTTATERQTAIVARDQQMLLRNPALCVIMRPYIAREITVPVNASADPVSEEFREADLNPGAWAVMVSRLGMTAGNDGDDSHPGQA